MTSDETRDPSDDRQRFRVHWTIFLPALVVACLYGGLWLFLVAAARGDTAIARLLLLVAVVGAPLLLAHASLRHLSFGLAVGSRGLWYRRGWLRPHWRRVPLAQIARVDATRGLAGHLVGGGALVVRLKTGERLRLDDVSAPLDAARTIERRIADLGEGAG
ncbi:MAG: PH domain-containing protein [Methyloligellaceae bacterium]